jgi:hypothetical protein
MKSTSRRVRVAATAAICALALAACGGGESAKDTTAPTTEAADTTAAPATEPADTTEPPATEPPVTEPPVTEPPATEPPVTEPPVVTFTSDELVAALPVYADIGAPWEDNGSEAFPDPAPDSGPGIGSCGRTNGAARAEEYGAVGAAVSPLFVQGQQRHRVNAVVYSFPSDEDAASYIAASRAANECPDGLTWSMTEGEGDGMFDGFADGFADGTTWEHSGAYAASDITVEGADEALLTTTEVSRTNDIEGVVFGETDIDLVLYTRHGSIVIVTILGGRCCSTGYLNADQIVEYRPTEDEVVALGQRMAEVTLTNLGVG